jgi:hypothetical protein
MRIGLARRLESSSQPSARHGWAACAVGGKSDGNGRTGGFHMSNTAASSTTSKDNVMSRTTSAERRRSVEGLMLQGEDTNARTSVAPDPAGVNYPWI